MFRGRLSLNYLVHQSQNLNSSHRYIFLVFILNFSVCVCISVDFVGFSILHNLNFYPMKLTHFIHFYSDLLCYLEIFLYCFSMHCVYPAFSRIFISLGLLLSITHMNFFLVPNNYLLFCFWAFDYLWESGKRLCKKALFKKSSQLLLINTQLAIYILKVYRNVFLFFSSFLSLFLWFSIRSYILNLELIPWQECWGHSELSLLSQLMASLPDLPATMKYC